MATATHQKQAVSAAKRHEADRRRFPMPAPTHRLAIAPHPLSAPLYPDAWYDPAEAKGLDGHQHAYGFRSLACLVCGLGVAIYQYDRIPGSPKPERPARAIVAVCRVDRETVWLEAQIKAGERQLYTEGMFDEYGDVWEWGLQRPHDSDGVWLGEVDLWLW